MLQASSSFQLTKIMAISASFSRPDSDIGLWKTYTNTHIRTHTHTHTHTHTNTDIKPSDSKRLLHWILCIFIFDLNQQDTCLSPPALSEGLPRISPQSGSAHGCNPVSSSPGGPASPDCSGLHTLQRRRNTQEEGLWRLFFFFFFEQMYSTKKIKPLLQPQQYHSIYCLLLDVWMKKKNKTKTWHCCLGT